jgi:hypothetical protein
MSKKGFVSGDFMTILTAARTSKEMTGEQLPKYQEDA